MNIRRINTALRTPRLCRRHMLRRSFAATVLLLISSLVAHAYDLHFDYTSFETTFKQAQFDVLNYPSINGNYMMTSTDKHRPEMVAGGNNLAEFYNWVQQRYDAHTTKDGNLSADEIDAYVVNNSANNGPRPTWIILNEISSSLWSANAGPPSISTYRTWLMIANSFSSEFSMNERRTSTSSAEHKFARDKHGIPTIIRAVAYS